ncbi:MAG: hypothetical protein AAF664_05885 [Planctomycetota bacterium]
MLRHHFAESIKKPAQNDGANVAKWVRALQSDTGQIPLEHESSYRAIRERSTLGQIFELANGIRDQIDSAIVVGDSAVNRGPQALIQARCDRYHNEMSRQLRGSKPRLYWIDETSSNDHVRSTIERLRNHDDSPLGSPPGILLIWSVSSPKAESALQPLIPWLMEQVGFPRVRCLVSGASEFSFGDMDHQVLRSDQPLSGQRSIFQPPGLLPLALLGLNVIKFLEGAVETTRSLRRIYAIDRHPDSLGEKELERLKRLDHEMKTWSMVSTRPLARACSRNELSSLATWVELLFPQELIIRRDSPIEAAGSLLAESVVAQKIVQTLDRHDRIETDVGFWNSMAAGPESFDHCLDVGSAEVFELGAWGQMELLASQVAFDSISQKDN